jgi:hypothetical protein
LEQRYRFRWYQKLNEDRQRIYEDAKKVAVELGLEKFEGQVGLYPTGSSCPPPLPNYVLEAITKASRTTAVLPMTKIEDRLREIVKDVYGDDYDAAATNTCESALRICFEALCAPPTMRKGDAYRTRFLTLYNHDNEYMGGYGRPFPPKYKNIWIDRSVSAGELGVEGKSLVNLDAIVVPFAGGKYECHGIKYNIVPLLMGVDASKTVERIEEIANQHISTLSGFECLGYDTPGYGFGDKDSEGIPKIQKMIGNLSKKFDVPFIVDCAMGIPFIGTDLRKISASTMLWSMDKSCRAITSGLIVGKEDVMVTIRKGLGLGGQRGGTLSSHGKAAYSACDPGRDAVISQIAVLEVIKDSPKTITNPIDELHEIVKEEFSRIEPACLREGLTITKSYNMGSVEVNYERTWKDGKFGIPIFNGEDQFADSLLDAAIEQMGVYPPIIYDGNILLSPWQGTTGEDGQLIEERTRPVLRAVVRAVEIVCKYAGIK